jgi:glycerol-3-phosphate dehydrogenase
MERDLRRLSDHVHGLLIIGGGIYGATAAWDAASRGLSVALVEKGDFGGATSMNSLKTVHGGLRYLQQLDFRRMRESIGERSTLLRIAPHLVKPLPFLIPTYGHTKKGREALAIALKLADLVGYDRNRNLDPSRRIPGGRTISRDECIRLIPDINMDGLTGGASWYDCLMYSTERLLLSFIISACETGAAVANYVSADSFIIEKGTVKGVVAKDLLSGQEFDIRAKVTLNMSGPWFNEIIEKALGKTPRQKACPSKAMNIVVKQIFKDHAVGLPSSHTYLVGDRSVQTGSRYLFTVPWRNHTLIGTTHLHYDGSPDEFSVTDEDITQFLEEVNSAYPSLSLKSEDVLFAYGGLLPMTQESIDRDRVDLVKQYRIHDHGTEDGIEGLVSVLGVKYTTARDVSEKAVDHVFRKLGFSPIGSVSAEKPIYGGDIEQFSEFIAESMKKKPADFTDESFDHILHCYGSRYEDVLEILENEPSAAELVTGSRPVTKLQVIQGVREEMAMKLTDVVMRRTELGSVGFPGEEALTACARLMEKELGWSDERTEKELSEARSLFDKFRN